VAIRQARELQREGLNVYWVMDVEMKPASKGRNDLSRGAYANVAGTILVGL
jgi:hypothetical protein